MAHRLSDNALKETLNRLQRLRVRRDDLTEEIDEYKEALMGHLEAIGADELTQFGWIISNKEITTTKLDAKALRAELPEVAARYSTTSTGRRFVVRAVV